MKGPKKVPSIQLQRVFRYEARTKPVLIRYQGGCWYQAMVTFRQAKAFEVHIDIKVVVANSIFMGFILSVCKDTFS